MADQDPQVVLEELEQIAADITVVTIERLQRLDVLIEIALSSENPDLVTLRAAESALVSIMAAFEEYIKAALIVVRSAKKIHQARLEQCPAQ